MTCWSGGDRGTHKKARAPWRVSQVLLLQRVDDLRVADPDVDADLERRRPGCHHVVQQRLSQGLLV